MPVTVSWRAPPCVSPLQPARSTSSQALWPSGFLKVDPPVLLRSGCDASRSAEATMSLNVDGGPVTCTVVVEPVNTSAAISRTVFTDSALFRERAAAIARRSPIAAYAALPGHSVLPTSRWVKILGSVGVEPAGKCVKEPPALVVMTADHGESLGEHGELTHGLFAYEGTLKVPLVVGEDLGAFATASPRAWGALAFLSIFATAFAFAPLFAGTLYPSG